jgi:hypothetical protein
MHIDRIRPDADVTAEARAAVDQTDVLPATGGQRDDAPGTAKSWHRSASAMSYAGRSLHPPAA